jgi:hypothetical protein
MRIITRWSQCESGYLSRSSNKTPLLNQRTSSIQVFILVILLCLCLNSIPITDNMSILNLKQEAITSDTKMTCGCAVGMYDIITISYT